MPLNTFISACSIALAAGLATAQATQPAPVPPAGSGAVTTPARRAVPMPFERSKWLVTLKPDKAGADAGAKEIEDALTFADGRMASHVGAALGFAPATCVADSTSAHCISESSDPRGRREWQIECARDALSGSMVATLRDGGTVRYRLEGRRAPPLEGTTWAIKLEPDAAASAKGVAATHDSIAFVCGKLVAGASTLTSVTRDAASYTLTTNGARHSLRAAVELEGGGSSEWTAEIDGDVIKGTLRISDREGAVRTLTFQGLKAPAPAPLDTRSEATSRPASDARSR